MKKFTIALALSLVATLAYAADVGIPDLSAIDSLAADDEFECVNVSDTSHGVDGSSRRCTMSQLFDYVEGASGTYTGTNTHSGTETFTGTVNLPAAIDLPNDSVDAADISDDAIYTATASKSAAYTIGTDDGKESYGGIVYVTSAATITAPAVTSGMSFTVITIGAIAVSLDVNASDKMYLDGTLLDDGDQATNTSTTGDLITCSYYSADGWYCASGSPDGDNWTDGS